MALQAQLVRLEMRALLVQLGRRVLLALQVHKA
jgi:hypothetical protein